MDAFRAKCLTYNQDDMLGIEHENATVIYSQTSGRERELSRFRAVKLGRRASEWRRRRDSAAATS